MKVFLLLLVTISCNMLKAQYTMPLYTGAIPNSIGTKDEERSEVTGDNILIIHKVSHPTLTVYLPPKEKANGTAVIICPGGGYGIVAAGHEGADVAKAFTSMGITAFVLKYRIPDTLTMVNREIGPLQDVQRAIQLVREHAKEWNVNVHRVGIMGFSAGGHLAASAGVHYNDAVIDNPQHISLRPDFMLLIYPVISFRDSIGHIGSRNNLLGLHPSPEKITYYSNELQVTDDTPPTFLVHAKDDDVVLYRNSTIFYEALQQHKVATGIFLYEKGGHGFGMHNPQSNDAWMPKVNTWMDTIVGD